jgi:lysine-specific demethylase 8
MDDFKTIDKELLAFINVVQQQSEHNPLATVIMGQIKELLNIDLNQPFSSAAYKNAQALLDFVWERLNTGHWSEVDLVWRQLYSVISVIKVICVFRMKKITVKDQDSDCEVIKDLVKICDIGLLMGAPILDNICSRMATSFSKQLVKTIPDHHSSSDIPTKKIKLANLLNNHINVKSVEIRQDLSFEEFLSKYKTPERPVLVKDLLEDWPALTADDHTWNIDYFRKIMGFRTIPVEIGRRYTDESWTQNLMTVNDFIDKYILDPKPDSIGYLAQHELFQQVPELKEDFDIPLYCFSDDDKDDDDIAVNVWFGPGGTVSPLHTDPKHNCLCQVFGTKYVRLYTSDQTEFIYPYDPEDILSNTSRIDLEEKYSNIVEKYPKFDSATGFECILEPGDVLYIPPKCWHFVKSLSPSCSLSFWFQ